MDKYAARKKIKKIFLAKQDRLTYQQAIIGNLSGVVDVVDEPGWIWAQVAGAVTKIYCAPGLSRTPGMSVMVGYLPQIPDLYQVVGVSLQGSITYQGGATIGKHRTQHEWPNSDAVMIDERQITPLRITPIGGFLVNVLPGFVWIDNALYYVSLANPFMLNSLVPTTAGKVRFVWIVIDNTGTLQTVTGDEVDTADFDTTVVPTFADTVAYVLGAVRLFTEQTSIWEGMDSSDVLDLRFPIWHKGGSSSGHIVQDEGTPLTARANLNFIGAGVTATDNAGTGATDVTVPGGGHTIQDAGSAMATQPNLNFVGATVMNDAGNSATVVTIAAPTITSASNDLTWFVDGTIAALASLPQAFVMPRDSTIEKVIAVISGTGGSGSTIIDINLGGTTIFTTQANRPTIAAGGSSSSIKIPDVVTLHTGDVITLDIDSAGVGASGLTVVVAMTVPAGGGGGGGGGDVYGSASVTDGHLAVFDTDGYHIKDGGVVPTGGSSIYTPPPTTGWSWVNQGPATLIEADDRIAISVPAGTTSDLRCRIRAVPSTPYVLTAYFEAEIAVTAYPNSGLVLYDSASGKFITFQVSSGGPMYYLVQYYNAATNGFAATAYILAMVDRRVWFRVTDDGTTRSFLYSISGDTWMPLFSHAHTDWITPTDIGILADSSSNNTWPCGITLRSWEVT